MSHSPPPFRRATSMHANFKTGQCQPADPLGTHGMPNRAHLGNAAPPHMVAGDHEAGHHGVAVVLLVAIAVWDLEVPPPEIEYHDRVEVEEREPEQQREKQLDRVVRQRPQDDLHGSATHTLECAVPTAAKASTLRLGNQNRTSTSRKPKKKGLTKFPMLNAHKKSVAKHLTGTCS